MAHPPQQIAGRAVGSCNYGAGPTALEEDLPRTIRETVRAHTYARLAAKRRRNVPIVTSADRPTLQMVLSYVAPYSGGAEGTTHPPIILVVRNTLEAAIQVLQTHFVQDWKDVRLIADDSKHYHYYDESIKTMYYVVRTQ